MSADQKKISLGKFLKAERVKKEKSLESIASETKVRLALLEALEADKYSALPARPFLRGFIISYCKAIDCDPERVLHEYKNEFDKVSEDGSIGLKTLGGYTFEDTKSDKSLLTIILFGFSLVLIISLALFFTLGDRVDWIEKIFNNQGISTDYQGTQEAINGGLPDNPEKIEPKSFNEAEETTETGSDLIEDTVTPPPVDATHDESTGGEETAQRDESVTPDSENLPSVEPNRTPSKTDSLFKGDLLPPERIHYKVVFKAKDDVWLRYKTDDFEMQTFKLLQNRLLVIRAEKWIYYQIENSQSLSVRFDLDGEYSSLQNKKHFIIHDSLATGVHPQSLSPTIPQIFDSKPKFE